MRTAVILQPQYFPWAGVFEQINLADVYIHLDDVQLPQGRSFCSRVQLKTQRGQVWLTVPIIRNGLQIIKDTKTDESQPWRKNHLIALRESLKGAPFAEDAVAIAADTLDLKSDYLSDICIFGIEQIVKYLNINVEFGRSSELISQGLKDDRIISLLNSLSAEVYVTGHGAKKYMDHEKMDRAGKVVEYMDYNLSQYPQLHGEFTPYVTFLDAIANLGPKASSILVSQSIPWRKALGIE